MDRDKEQGLRRRGEIAWSSKPTVTKEGTQYPRLCGSISRPCCMTAHQLAAWPLAEVLEIVSHDRLRRMLEGTWAGAYTP
jgi:hypothetical protein